MCISTCIKHVVGTRFHTDVVGTLVPTRCITEFLWLIFLLSVFLGILYFKSCIKPFVSFKEASTVAVPLEEP